MTPVVNGTGLALVRGGRLLFERIDIILAPGAALHVTGPNGSGKSSLIRMIAGLLTPSTGRIERAAAALADERLALDRELSLDRALAFWRGARTAEAMILFDLQRLAKVPVRLLSAGQSQRAKLARVAASGAPLWLLDEPLNGLDSDGIECLSRAIDAHRADGGAILAAHHGALPGRWQELAL